MGSRVAKFAGIGASVLLCALALAPSGSAQEGEPVPSVFTLGVVAMNERWVEWERPRRGSWAASNRRRRHV
jgi:hypothetical protein